MPALTTDILAWIKDGFREGVPDGEAPALYAVLTDRIGTERAADVLRRLHAAGQLSDAAAGALLPDEAQKRQVAAKLVLGGWPLDGGGTESPEDTPPRESSALGRIVAWLREGYPGGVPDHDYVPLLALLERRLTRSEVKQIAKALRRRSRRTRSRACWASSAGARSRRAPRQTGRRRPQPRLAGPNFR